MEGERTSDVVVAACDGEKDVAPLAKNSELLEPSSPNQRNGLARLPPLLAVGPHGEGARKGDRQELEAARRSCGRKAIRQRRTRWAKETNR